MNRYQILRNFSSSRWVLPTLVTTASIGLLQDTGDNENHESHNISATNNNKYPFGHMNQGCRPFSKFSVFHPTKTSLEGSSPLLETQHSQPAELDKPTCNEFDFVVVGNGNAGRQAIETLREQCPNASIAVIDPYRPCFLNGVTYEPTTVVGFHPIQRTLYLAEDRPNLKYRHAVLVASGARGAPPPLSLFDQDALDRVLEIRSTALPKSNIRPSVSAEAARHVVLMAASQGAKIGILGSGWEAVELAAAVSRVAGSKPPVIVFESPGPLAHILPKYLGAEVAARLRQQGMVVMERSLVRYVQNSHRDRSSSIPKLELHTAKSYDLMETKRTSIDLLVGTKHVFTDKDESCGNLIFVSSLCCSGAKRARGKGNCVLADKPGPKSSVFYRNRSMVPFLVSVDQVEQLRPINDCLLCR
jgi:hypothetical protein